MKITKLICMCVALVSFAACGEIDRSQLTDEQRQTLESFESASAAADAAEGESPEEATAGTNCCQCSCGNDTQRFLFAGEGNRCDSLNGDGCKTDGHRMSLDNCGQAEPGDREKCNYGGANL